MPHTAPLCEAFITHNDDGSYNALFRIHAGRGSRVQTEGETRTYRSKQDARAWLDQMAKLHEVEFSITEN